MNKYKDNHEFFQSVFDEVHASDKLIRKVQSMSNTKTKKKVYALRKIIYIAAAIITIFTISNVVAYAATGETWVEQIVVHIMLGGEKQEVVADKIVDENGAITYELEMNVNKDDVNQKIRFSLPYDEKTNDSYDYEVELDASVIPLYSSSLLLK